MAMQESVGFVNVFPSQPSVVQKPREIGYIERIQGLETGISELLLRLSSFSQRIDPRPEQASGNDCPAPSGMSYSLTRSEETLRSCLRAIEELSSRF